MKKYFLNIIVVAVLGIACVFVSCSKDDDNGSQIGDIPVFMVTLNGTSVDLAVNYSDKVQLIAVVSPNGAKVKDVEWSSSDQTVATVTADGLVTALQKEGTTTITVTTKDQAKTASCIVTVKFKEVLLEGFEFKFPEGVLVDGAFVIEGLDVTRDLSQYLKLDPSYTTNTSIKWTSTNPNIVSVDEKTGEVTTVFYGTVKIEVNATETHLFMGEPREYTYYASCNVYVPGPGLIYEYTEDDLALCTFDSGVMGTYAYWYSNGSSLAEDGEIFMCDIDGFNKSVLNLNLRTAWYECAVLVKMPASLSNQTINYCNRIEVDYLIPKEYGPDRDHEIRTRFVSQGVTLESDQRIKGPYILGGEPYGDYYLVTVSVLPSSNSNFVMFSQDDTSDFIFRFSAEWWDAGTDNAVCLAGLRFYID